MYDAGKSVLNFIIKSIVCVLQLPHLTKYKMAKPWESKHTVMSDLDKLCDMYEPVNNKREKPVKIKLLTEGRNPSPFTIGIYYIFKGD